MDRPRSPAMSAPPVTSYVRTPPRKSLIYKPFENRPSLILLVLVLALSAGHPCGVPPRLRRGSPSGIKCPPSGGRIGSPRLRGLRPCPAGRCPSGLPALAAVRLGGQAGGLRPSTAPTRIGWVVSVASRPSRCAVAARALTRLPLGVQPASEARRPKAEGFSLLKKLKLGGARPKAAQLEPVGYVGEGWGAGGQSLWASSWAGAACPSACPAGLSTGRAKRASRWPLAAIVHISTGWQGSEATAQGEARRASPKGAATGAAGHDFAKQSLVSTLSS